MGHPKDYPYISAWGRLMGSNQSYIDDQLRDVPAGGVRDTVERVIKDA